MTSTDQTFEFPELNFETKAQESEPYLGIIVSSERSRSVFNGEQQTQWIYMVRPIRHASGIPLRASKTGLFYGFIKIPDGIPGERSVLMRTIKEFNKVFGARDENNVVRGPNEQLVGLVAWFQQKSYSFGKGMSDSKPAPTPVSRATVEEWAEAQALPSIEIPDLHRNENVGEGTAPAPIRNDIDLSNELVVSLVLSMYDGRTRAQVAKKAMANQDLDDDVRRDLISGAFLNALIEAGLAKINDDNTVAVVAPAAAQ